MKINRLLVGTLALVLMVGLGTPVFADEGGVTPINNESQPLTSEELLAITAADDVIFDNGGVPNTVGGNPLIRSPFLPAEDFILNEDVSITDFHFVLDTFSDDTGDFTRNIEYFIFSDNSGQPGNILASGNLVDLEFEQINDRFAEVWYFLDVPFEAEGGVTYWFGILAEDDADYGWSATDAGQGSQACRTTSVPPTDDWNCNSGFNLWFLLTGNNDQLVGGELLPIDSAALMLAGLQSSAIWMLPILAGAAGASAFFIKTRMNKD